MTKKDIASGDLVLLRDGRVCIVLKDLDDPTMGLTLYGNVNSPFSYFLLESSPKVIGKVIHLCDYDDDLTSDGLFSNDNYDIMAVRKTSDFGLKFSVPFIFNLILYSCKEPDRIFWDWQREEVKEVTMAEVEEKFGCKVKIVKGE